MRTIPLPKLFSFARLCAVSLAVVVTLAACSDGDDATSGLADPSAAGNETGGAEARALAPAFTSLDLDTPEAALATFAAAFDTGDYLTAYRTLSAESQEILLLVGASLGDVRVAITQDSPDWADSQYRFAATADLRDATASVVDRREAWWMPAEFYGEQQFADLVASSALVIDLTGGVRAIEPVSIDDVHGTAVLEAELGATGLPVTVTTTRAADGRWRVHQIAAAGGDLSHYPFAADRDGPPSVVEAQGWTSTYDRLRHDDPDAVVAQTIALFEARDWRLLIGSMHPDTRSASFTALATLEFEGRFLTLDTPSYENRIAALVDGGSVGALNLVPFQHGAETGTLLVDLTDGTAAPTEPTEPWGESTAQIALVEANGRDHLVTVAMTPSGRWALAQIRTPDGSSDPEAAPFSAPPDGFIVPVGATLCPDGITRYDCDATGLGLSENDQRRIDELRAEAEADPSLEATNAVIIDSITSGGRKIALDQACAAMQLGFVHDDSIDWTDTARQIDRIVDEYCPGDPDVIPTG